jgi:hypothetical protein
MKRIIRLTESDLTRIVRRVIKEQTSVSPNQPKVEVLNPKLTLKVLNDDNDERVANITIDTIRVGNTHVLFTAKDPFNKQRDGKFACDEDTVVFTQPFMSKDDYTKVKPAWDPDLLAEPKDQAYLRLLKSRQGEPSTTTEYPVPVKFTEEGNKKLQAYCDRYVSNGNKNTDRV